MGTHISSPLPISATVRQCLADFKKSHQVCSQLVRCDGAYSFFLLQDSWVEDQKAFSSEQQMELNDLLIPANNYYA